MILPDRVRQVLATILPLVATLLAMSCGVRESEQTTLSLESPLHLEEHLAEAQVETSRARFEVPDAIEWRFEEPQPDWRARRHVDPDLPPLRLDPLEDALRVVVADGLREPDRDRLHGDLCVVLPPSSPGPTGATSSSGRGPPKTFEPSGWA